MKVVSTKRKTYASGARSCPVLAELLLFDPCDSYRIGKCPCDSLWMVMVWHTEEPWTCRELAVWHKGYDPFLIHANARVGNQLSTNLFFFCS